MIDDLKSKQAIQEGVTRQVAELETETHRVSASLQDQFRQLEQIKSKQLDQEGMTMDKFLAGNNN
mgnify:CR=1 FL=1